MCSIYGPHLRRCGLIIVPYRRQLEVGEHVVEVVVFAEFEVDHLVLEFEHPAHDAVEDVTQDSALLRMNDLVVALLKAPEDLDVLDVHGSQQLERRHTVLQIKKGKKSSPYSTAEHRVPELIPILDSQPAGDLSHKPDGRQLPFLSARPAVTLTTLKRAATNFAAWA